MGRETVWEGVAFLFTLRWSPNRLFRLGYEGGGGEERLCLGAGEREDGRGGREGGATSHHAWRRRMFPGRRCHRPLQKAASLFLFFACFRRDLKAAGGGGWQGRVSSGAGIRCVGVGCSLCLVGFGGRLSPFRGVQAGGREQKRWHFRMRGARGEAARKNSAASSSEPGDIERV